MESTWIGSPNFSRGRKRVTHITLHVMGGYLAGTDVTFLDPKVRASATYGIGSDGSIHQYVRESDTAWADSNSFSNSTGISIEHEGGIPKAQFTDACAEASAQLCADISRRYNLGLLVHDGTHGNVYLHREIPGTDHPDCPDRAPNGINVEQIITRANQILQGEDELSAKDIYDTRDQDGRNLFDHAHQILDDLPIQTRNALIETRGNDGRNVLDGVIQARNQIQTLQESVDQLTELVKQLQK